MWVNRCRINKKIRRFVSDLKVISEKKNDELHLNRHVLDELLGAKKALQNSVRSSQKTISDSENTRSSVLDRLENW